MTPPDRSSSHISDVAGDQPWPQYFLVQIFYIIRDKLLSPYSLLQLELKYTPHHILNNADPTCYGREGWLIPPGSPQGLREVYSRQPDVDREPRNGHQHRCFRGKNLPIPLAMADSTAS